MATTIQKTAQSQEGAHERNETLSRVTLKSEFGSEVIFALRSYRSTRIRELTVHIAGENRLYVGLGEQDLDRLATWLSFAKDESRAFKRGKERSAGGLNNKQYDMPDGAKSAATAKLRKPKKGRRIQ